MILGFTGSSRVITREQIGTLRKILQMGSEVHHGDCVVADQVCHNIAVSLGISTYIHPPDNDYKRAFCSPYTGISEPKSYLRRNKDIIDSCEYLIAVPNTFEEQLRSGTWSTVRYAAKKNKPIMIINPDGSTYRYNSVDKHSNEVYNGG